MAFQRVCTVQSLHPRGIRPARVGGAHLTVALAAGAAYAFAYECPRCKMALAIGELDEQALTLACKGCTSRFDLRDGHPLYWLPSRLVEHRFQWVRLGSFRARPLTLYAARLEDGAIYVDTSGINTDAGIRRWIRL